MQLVSVIIPTYNRAELLPRAVESVLAQSYPGCELIIIDDGSTDGTEQYLASLGEDIICIGIPHSGVSRARNRGIAAASGDWIAFLDSDDYWLPMKLERQACYLREHPEYRICHTDEIWIRNGTRINQGKKHRKRDGWFFLESLNLCLISPSSVLIHRSILNDVGGFDESFEWVEDYDLWLRITSRYPVGYIDEKLVVKTGGHYDQLSSKTEGIERQRIRALEKIIAKGALSGEFRKEAVRVYRKKCAIYLAGCRKRSKNNEIRRVQSRMETVLGVTVQP
jgi:glycosyltransferase involved in cell wall biosynthesis